jgi:hypothetical protein
LPSTLFSKIFRVGAPSTKDKPAAFQSHGFLGVLWETVKRLFWNFIGA